MPGPHAMPEPDREARWAQLSGPRKDPVYLESGHGGVRILEQSFGYPGTMEQFGDVNAIFNEEVRKFADINNCNPCFHGRFDGLAVAGNIT